MFLYITKETQSQDMGHEPTTAQYNPWAHDVIHQRIRLHMIADLGLHNIPLGAIIEQVRKIILHSSIQLQIGISI